MPVKRSGLILLCMFVYCSVFASTERQAQGILRFNRCLSRMVSASLSADPEEAVRLYMKFAPPKLGLEGEQAWRQHLKNFAELVEELKVESLELVSIERVSTQTYIYRYILHGEEGPILFIAKAYCHKDMWRSCGFSFKTDIDIILEDLEGEFMLPDPVPVKLAKISVSVGGD